MQRSFISVSAQVWLPPVCVVAFVAGVNAVAAVISLAMPALQETALDMAVDLLLAACAIIMLTTLRSWRQIGFRALARWKDLQLFWLPLFPVLPVIPAVIASMAGMRLVDVAHFLILACLIGFVEEVYFRGFILQAIARKGPWRAAIMSSLGFGVMHLVNLMFGADVSATLLQAAYAVPMGFAFAAVVLHCGVLWPLIIIHALIDFTGFVTTHGTTPTAVTPDGIFIDAVYAAIFTVYGIVLLRSAAREPTDGRLIAPRHRISSADRASADDIIADADPSPLAIQVGTTGSPADTSDPPILCPRPK